MPKYLRNGFTLIEIMIVTLLIAMIVAIALPNYLKITSASKKTICINNLKQIDGAIDRWAIDNQATEGSSPSPEEEEEIYVYIKGGKPACPSGGTYTIYQVGIFPQVRCSREAEGHRLTE